MLPALSDMNMRLIYSPLLWGFTYISKRRYLSIWSSGQMSSLWMTNKCFHFHRLSPLTLLMALRRSSYHILSTWLLAKGTVSFFFPRKPQCSLRQSRGEFKGRRETRLTFCTQHAHFLSGYSLFVVSFMLQVFNSLRLLCMFKKKKKKKKTF